MFTVQNPHFKKKKKHYAYFWEIIPATCDWRQLIQAAQCAPRGTTSHKVSSLLWIFSNQVLLVFYIVHLLWSNSRSKLMFDTLTSYVPIEWIFSNKLSLVFTQYIFDIVNLGVVNSLLTSTRQTKATHYNILQHMETVTTAVVNSSLTRLTSSVPIEWIFSHKVLLVFTQYIFDIVKWGVKTLLTRLTSREVTHCNTLQHTATHCNTLQHTNLGVNSLLTRLTSSAYRVNILKNELTSRFPNKHVL